jgi:hypothetical protein
MNISDIAEDIVNLVQSGLADKVNPTKINRSVTNVLNKLVKSLVEAQADEDFVVIINTESGVPTGVTSNNTALNGALFVCVDNIAVADDEDNAVIVYDDNIVIGTGDIAICDDVSLYVRAARKYERLNY